MHKIENWSATQALARCEEMVKDLAVLPYLAEDARDMRVQTIMDRMKRIAEDLAFAQAPAPEPHLVGSDHMLRLAVAAVLEADTEFRSNMMPGWEGDPLSDEIDGLRRIFEAEPSSAPRLGVTAEEYNRAFDAANEALGGAFMAGFREGWIYAEIDADGERYQEMAEEYALAVDSAPQEAWDAHRAEFFNKLPLAALPEVPDNG